MTDVKEVEILGPDFIKEPIRFIKNSHYKGTAFKVELEGNLHRNGSSISCLMCSGRGYRFCRDCADGFIDGTKKLTCKTCNGWARIPCGKCNAKGSMTTRFMNDRQCSDFMLDNVSSEAKDALIFSKFYPDGSVGSEFTFTLPIEKSFYSIEFIKAWNLLVEHIGGGNDTNGAGMHLAILNSSNGYYPEGNELNNVCRDNFGSAMSHFLPALYFLGSTSFKSRGLNYRGPQISSTKYSAINFADCVFEYRFFETCYERPEAILDDLCVIAKTLEYYKPEETKLPFFDTLGNFTFRDGLGVHRFYFTEAHLKALDAGLEYLKPDHKTVKQLKRERNFTITYDNLKKMDQRFDLRTEREWRSYNLRLKRDKKFSELTHKANYARHVRSMGKELTKETYGTLSLYLKTHLPKTDSLNSYKAKKKKELLTSNIVATVRI